MATLPPRQPKTPAEKRAARWLRNQAPKLTPRRLRPHRKSRYRTDAEQAPAHIRKALEGMS